MTRTAPPDAYGATAGAQPRLHGDRAPRHPGRKRLGRRQLRRTPPAANAPSALGRQAGTAPAPAKPASRITAPRATHMRGRLVLRTTPAGARVADQRQVAGPDPLTRAEPSVRHPDGSPGTAGYQPLQRRVVLNATRPVETSRSRRWSRCGRGRGTARGRRHRSRRPPAPAEAGFHGGVIFESRPAGAKVFIDDKLVGMTPMALPSVPAGSHAVRFEHNGFRRWSSSVRVVAGERTRVAASLEEDTHR